MPQAAPCPNCGSPAGPGHHCAGIAAKLLGKLLDGRYRIEEVVGEGGMGSVYRAVQTSFQRPVAVKTLHPSLASSPRFFERFRREAELASRLRHPNIITVFDFGRTEDGTCYYVMELVEGQSVRQMVKQAGAMSLRRAVNVIEQAGRGLAHAHAMGAVHRDLKPHNLMIQAFDGREFIKLLDFGLVKILEEDDDLELTSTGQVLGTPQYMPPEQAGGDEVDERSDLYSLGAVFYFCLTGSSPFGANSVRKALTAALTQPVPTVASRRVGAPVPPAVEAFIQKALAREKKDRHENAEHFVNALLESVEELSDDELDAPPHGSTQPALSGAPAPRARSPESRRGASAKAPAPAPVPSVASAASTRSAVATGASTREDHREISREETASGPLIPLSRRRLIRRVGAALGTALLGAGVVYALGFLPGRTVAETKPSRGEQAPAHPAVASQRPAQPPTPVPAPPARPAPAENVLVTVRSTPSGAEVWENNVFIGRTPASIQFTREIHTLSFRLPGRESLERKVDLSRLAEDRTSLEIPLPAPKPPAHAPPRKKKKPEHDIPTFE